MSPPSANFFSPDPAAVAASPLAAIGAVPTSPASGTPNFETVLADAGEPAVAAPAEGDDTGAADSAGAPRAAESGATTAATVDQLVLLAGVMAPVCVMEPPPPATAPSGGTEGTPTLECVGACGRSVGELLSQGAERLEYRLQPGMVRAVETPAAQVMPAISSEQTDLSSVAAPLVEPGLSTNARGELAEAPRAAQPVTVTSSRALLPETRLAGQAETAPVEATVRLPGTGMDAQPLGTRSAEGPTTESAGKPTRDAVARPEGAAAVASIAMGDAVAAAQPKVSSPSAASKLRPGSSVPAQTAVRQVENSAGGPAAIPQSGGNASVVPDKNTVLTPEAKAFASSLPRVGTSAANWGNPMLDESRNFAGLNTPAAAAGSSGFAITNEAAVAETASPVAAHASALVHEIREIADGLWSVERNSVEVKFNFGQDDLSVRVEYRDGAVHATFRTESPELRDVIAREWHAQPHGSSEKPYRMADPVFSSSSGFSFQGDSSRQQRSADQAAAFERSFAGAVPRNASSTTAIPAPVSAARTGNSGLLHALV